MKSADDYNKEYWNLVEQQDKLNKRIMQKIIRVCKQYPKVIIQKNPVISGKSIVENNYFISWMTISSKIGILKSIEKQINS